MAATRYWRVFEDCEVIQAYGVQKIRPREPVFPEKPLKSALECLNSFIFTHPMFQPAVSTARWGSLQLINRTIIQHVEHRAAELGVPKLPVHDEVITPVSAELMLAKAFQQVLKGMGDIRTVRLDCSVKGAEKEALVEALQGD